MLSNLSTILLARQFHHPPPAAQILTPPPPLLRTNEQGALTKLAAWNSDVSWTDASGLPAHIRLRIRKCVEDAPTNATIL